MLGFFTVRPARAAPGVVLALLLPAAARAGELSQAHDAMRPQPASSSSRSGDEPREKSRSGRHGSGGGSDDSDESDSPFGRALLYVFFSPWVLPPVVVEGDGPREFAYERYPYADGATGALRVGPPVDSQFDKPWADGTAPPPPGTGQLASQVSADQAYVLGGLSRTSFAARLQTPLRVELDTLWSLYVEPLPHGADSAWSGNAHVSYRFAQSSRVQFRTGLGYRQWTDARGTELGPDLMYGLDVFWGRPLSTSITLNVGTLGTALVAQARATLGVLLGPIELFAGYEHLAIQGTASALGGGVGLGGPLLGLRAWL